ncbi:MAG: hypothetical protein AB1899_13210 [Pseudomonadota bacterium]
MATLLPRGPQQAEIARALAVATDGAIIRAQIDAAPDPALEALARMVEALNGGVSPLTATRGKPKAHRPAVRT